ncbi:peptide deformylase [Pseudogemmobacter humi]|uniref:Peptide deformylase n=1 Tax=Pseudogemmobacter humi TaxID=2483812 RepID=A0A3P5WRT2_9RHOB|nr:peptide deformylase [Pseudogemmobacter humi]VDC26093.1 Peptide deformylase [Pseudogemmobacter humi]
MILPLLLWPAPRLSQPCEPAPSGEETARLAADMLETMYEARGRGLAAPQVGRLVRLFVMDLTWKEGARAPQVFVNPEILWSSGEQRRGPESCLSIPGPVTMVGRATAIRLGWSDPEGRAYQAELTGIAAICAQHEMDHLDGILTLDRLAPADRALAEQEIAA